MDFELEMGFLIGPGNELGTPVPIDRAAEHIFGLVLVNDWSARDIQQWEYVPLGPFLGKNFATSISPWVVTLDALEPFRCAGPAQDDPAPLPYLASPGGWAFDICTRGAAAERGDGRAGRGSRPATSPPCTGTSASSSPTTPSTAATCRPGDLLASGTISGSGRQERGSLLELAWRGAEPLALPSGETRSFLADGDTVIMRGHCEADGVRVGFGEVRGTLLPAREPWHAGPPLTAAPGRPTFDAGRNVLATDASTGSTSTRPATGGGSTRSGWCASCAPGCAS